MSVDCLGQELHVGQECVFSRNLWRGKDVLCKGVILSLSDKMAQVMVTGEPPKDGSRVYEGWNIKKKAKLTKLLGLQKIDDVVMNMFDLLEKGEIEKFEVKKVEGETKFEIWEGNQYCGRWLFSK